MISEVAQPKSRSFFIFMGGQIDNNCWLLEHTRLLEWGETNLVADACFSIDTCSIPTVHLLFILQLYWAEFSYGFWTRAHNPEMVCKFIQTERSTAYEQLRLHVFTNKASVNRWYASSDTFKWCHALASLPQNDNRKVTFLTNLLRFVLGFHSQEANILTTRPRAHRQITIKLFGTSNYLFFFVLFIYFLWLLTIAIGTTQSY